MFADLPEPMQEKVKEYLLENNFPAAKQLYDEYHRQQASQHPMNTNAPTVQSIPPESVHSPT